MLYACEWSGKKARHFGIFNVSLIPHVPGVNLDSVLSLAGQFRRMNSLSIYLSGSKHFISKLKSTLKLFTAIN